MTHALKQSRLLIESELDKCRRQLSHAETIGVSNTNIITTRVKVLEEMRHFYRQFNTRSYKKLREGRQRPSLKKQDLEPDKSKDIHAWAAWHERRAYRQKRNFELQELKSRA